MIRPTTGAIGRRLMVRHRLRMRTGSSAVPCTVAAPPHSEGSNLAPPVLAETPLGSRGSETALPALIAGDHD